jgi:Flp pilus assembly protein TadB
MSKRRSAYENEYTKQLEEAVFDQRGYDARKEEAKKKVQAESQRHKNLVRIFFFLCALGLAVAAYRIMNIEPSSAAPVAVLVTLAALVFAFIRWINK